MTDRLAVTCDAFEAEAAELALGQVDEPRRAELLEHAERCARCEELLGDLGAVSDRLLELAPQVEPPVGFEARAVARMAPARVSGLRRAVAAAAVALVLLGAGVALGRASAPDPDGAAVEAAVVTADGTRVGTAELERGPTDRIVLTMDGPATWDGTWTCELLAGGRWVEVGRWTADEVTGHVWAAGIDEALAGATEMRILGGSGAVIATADLLPS